MIYVFDINKLWYVKARCFIICIYITVSKIYSYFLIQKRKYINEHLADLIAYLLPN